jgi:hypothetical protein
MPKCGAGRRFYAGCGRLAAPETLARLTQASEALHTGQNVSALCAHLPVLALYRAICAYLIAKSSRDSALAQPFDNFCETSIDFRKSEPKTTDSSSHPISGR